MKLLCIIRMMGKKSCLTQQMFGSVRQSCCILFSPARSPMDWIYEKTLEYPMLWIYTLCILYNIHLYIYIAYIFIFKSRHALDFHPSWMQGSILSTYKRKQWELVQSHFLDTQKIQIHKIWDTKTRCKPGTLSNHFKMDAWCNNHFSCEDSKSI